MNDERKIVIEYGNNSPDILLDIVAAEIAARLFAGSNKNDEALCATNEIVRV